MKKRFAFTLVELLVVIGIIAVLIGIILPALGRARESSRRAACLSNLRQLGMMIQFYANDYKDQVPLGYSNGQPWSGYYICQNGVNYPVLGRLSRSRSTSTRPTRAATMRSGTCSTGSKPDRESERARERE